jgi:hypothetical protein
MIDRNNIKNIITDVVTSGMFILFSYLIFRINHGILRGFCFGLTFIISCLTPRILFPQPQVEAEGPRTSSLPKIGIIDTVWIFIMGSTLAFIGFTIGTPPFNEMQICEGMNPTYYQMLLDNTSFLLGKTIDTIFLVGGVLAGCMAILWSGELWRKSDPRSVKLYFLTTLKASKMVFAFFICATAGFGWVAYPLYNRFVIIENILKSIK